MFNQVRYISINSIDNFSSSGTIPGQTFMIPPQTAGGVQTYPTYDNSVPYNTYGPTATGKRM